MIRVSVELHYIYTYLNFSIISIGTQCTCDNQSLTGTIITCKQDKAQMSWRVNGKVQSLVKEYKKTREVEEKEHLKSP